MTQPIISRILLTFICLVTITISGQQQDVCSRFTYKFTYQPDSSDVQSKQLPPLRTRKLLATTRPKFREVEKAYREGTVARIERSFRDGSSRQPPAANPRKNKKE